MTDPATRYKTYLEALSPQTLKRLSDHVVPTVRFKDPFNDVTGIDPMERIFKDMFDNVENVKFTVHQVMSNGDRCLMEWRFEGRLRGKAWAFEGTSSLIFADDGRVQSHIDYWDAAGDFYQHLPLIGPVIRWLKRRVAVP